MVDDRVEETLVVDKMRVDELFGVMVDDFNVVVELFAETDDIFDVVVGDGMRNGAPFGAPLTTRN